MNFAQLVNHFTFEDIMPEELPDLSLEERFTLWFDGFKKDIKHLPDDHQMRILADQIDSSVFGKEINLEAKTTEEEVDKEGKDSIKGRIPSCSFEEKYHKLIN